MTDWCLPLVLAWQPLCMLLSALGTVAHTVEEYAGEGGPLWDYFGSIAGSRIPRLVGLLLFSVALPLGTIAVSAIGYGLDSGGWLSLLAGLRLGDMAFSHVLPSLWHRPNPGIFSGTVYYGVEGGLLLALVDVQPLAFGAGVAFFALVLPVLWLIGQQQAGA